MLKPFRISVEFLSEALDSARAWHISCQKLVNMTRTYCERLLRIAAFIATVAAVSLFAAPVHAQVSVTTGRYDNSRSGSNLSETTLNTSNVNVSQFGKLYSYTVDASIYAQPLYVPNVVIPGQGTYNVVYVATMNDSIYAFNADSNAVNGGILWSKNFTNSAAGVTSIPIVNIVNSNSLNIVGTVGIESTPVINLSSNTIYLVARTMEVSGSTTNYVARLHALDITTGAEKFGGPVVIQGSVPGSGQGSSAGTLTFSSFFQNQRSGLVLVNGLIVFSWASHEDFDDWHGWVMAYNAATLQQTSILCTTPNGENAGIWMSGRAPVADSSGNLYYATGNGDWDGVSSFGDSLIRVSTTNGTLSIADYFTPDNYAYLQANDLDFGSSGPLLIPGTNLLITAGKTSNFYVVQSSNLGHEVTGDTQTVQNFALGGSIKSGPAFWNRTTGAGATLYVWPAGSSPLQAFQVSGSSFNTTPLSESTFLTPSGYTDAALSVSANGSTAGTGIVWASLALSADDTPGTSQGVLRAFDANNVATELWDSEMDDARDDAGTSGKFGPPIVANGKVYLNTFSNTLNVYGLLAAQGFSVSATPSSQSVLFGGSTTFTVSTTALAGFTGSIGLSVSGLPKGATGTFSPTSVSAGSGSTLTVATTSSTPAGSYTLTIIGTSDSITQTATVTLVVTANFTMSATPGFQTVNPGGSTPYTVSTAAVGGFSGTVSLSVSGLPTGATGTFSPTSVSAGNSSTLTVATTSSTPTGSSSLTITGTSTGGTVTATVTLVVTSSGGTSGSPISIDFVGEDTPMTATAVAGMVAEPNWNSANGASSTSALSLVNSTGAATTASATWTSNDSWELGDGDGSANAQMMNGYLDTGNTTTTISLTDAANTNFTGTFTQANNSAGNYVVFTIPNVSGFTISATPGTSTDAYPRAPVNGIQIVPLSGPSFTMSATPSSQTVAVGGSTTTPYTVSTAAVGGFSGTVSLSVSGLPTGATGTFSPTSVSAGNSSTLTVATTSSTPTGSYPLTIIGTSGSITQTATVTLVVTSSGGTSGSPISIDFVGEDTPMTATAVAGVVAEPNWNSANGASSTSALSLVNSTGAATTASATWTSNDSWELGDGDGSANAQMMNGYLDTGDTTTTTVSVTGLPSNASGYQVYVYAQGQNGAATRIGNYTISGTGITTTTISLTDAANTNFTGTFTQANTSAGNYVVFTIPNVSGFTISATPGTSTDAYPRAPVNGIQIVPLSGPSFTMSATPSSQTVAVGGSTTTPYTVSTAAVGGFSGTVSLSVSGLPTGATGTFSPTSVSAGNSSTLTVATTSSTPTGSASLTITGTSTGGTVTATVTLVVTSSGGTSGSPISIDFVGEDTPMTATAVAGVAAEPNWNSANGASSTSALSLVNSTGAATTASATWTSNNSWELGDGDGSANAQMMNGYLDTGDTTTTTVSVTGLPSNASGYQVYVYAQGQNGAATRIGNYTISGTGITTTTISLTDAANTNFTGTFTQANNSAGNYVVFTIPNVSGFTISATPGTSTDAYPRAPVNGIQIVPK